MAPNWPQRGGAALASVVACSGATITWARPMTNDWKPGANSNLEQDWFDRRDLIYVPSLRALGPGRRTLDLLREANAGMAVCVTSGSPRPRFEVRNQRNSATCTGHALAALIDILRLIGGGDGPREPVSARMLYTLGREVEETRASEGVQTLRSVVKAFWHNGVCPENDWRDDDASDADSLTVERAKAARAVTLSSYFRVRTLLNDFHAAISEAGAILVSAKIHEGWSLGRVHGAGGAIRAPDEGVGGGVHAFVVLGWDAEGFLVLNSAGPDWGCWTACPASATGPIWIGRGACSTPGCCNWGRPHQRPSTCAAARRASSAERSASRRRGRRRRSRARTCLAITRI
jgi:hypothetical protein